MQSEHRENRGTSPRPEAEGPAARARWLHRAIRDPASLRSLDAASWSLLIRQARSARLLSRLALEIESTGLTAELPDKVRDAVEASRAVAHHHERTIRWEADRVSRALAGYDGLWILLKGGAYVLAGLPPGRGRIAADLDILVPKERLGEVERRLLEAGWESVKTDPYDQRYYREWMHELPPMRHRDRRSVLDVHHTILPETGRLHPDPEALIATAVPIPDTGYRMLSPEGMVLHAVAHLFQDGEVASGLRDLFDVEELIRRFGSRDTGFPERLVCEARRHELLRPLYYGVRYARLLSEDDTLAGLEEQVGLAAPSYPVRALMDGLVRLAMMPPADQKRGGAGRLAAVALYVRAHWLRMPLALLVPHLWRKAFRREDRKAG